MEMKINYIENKIKLKNDKINEIIQQLQNKIVKLDKNKLQQLNNEAKDLAIHLVLKLESQPAPPQTQYLIDDKSLSSSSSIPGSNQWDDLFNEVNEGSKSKIYDDPLWEEEEEEYKKFQKLNGFEEFEELAEYEKEEEEYKHSKDIDRSNIINKNNQFNSFEQSESENEENEEENEELEEIRGQGEEKLTTKELCQKWKEDFNVVIGFSWGNLPLKLQKRWKRDDCDFYLNPS